MDISNPLSERQQAAVAALNAARSVLASTRLGGRDGADPDDLVTVASFILTGRKYDDEAVTS